MKMVKSRALGSAQTSGVINLGTGSNRLILAAGTYRLRDTFALDQRDDGLTILAAPGAEVRDADPTSASHAAKIALWRKLPLSLSNRLGPLIARGLA